MPSEIDIMRRLMKLISATGSRIFRNNVGVGWVGRIVHQTPEEITLRNYRPLHAGLCEGSSDLIGWRPMKIEAHHVGQTVAVFVAVETKTKVGRATGTQIAFLKRVHQDGGVAIIASQDDHVAKVSGWKVGQAQDPDIDRRAPKVSSNSA